MLSHLSRPHALTSLLVLLKAAVHVSAHMRRVSPGVAAVLEDKKEVIFCHALLQTLTEVKTEPEKVCETLQREENNAHGLVHVEICLSL